MSDLTPAGLGDWVWVDHNWFDIVSDFSVLHSVDDPVGLAPQRLVDLAVRLVAYTGVVAARARAEDTSGQVGVGSGGEARLVDADAHVLVTDPTFSSVLDFG